MDAIPSVTYFPDFLLTCVPCRVLTCHPCCCVNGAWFRSVLTCAAVLTVPDSGLCWGHLGCWGGTNLFQLCWTSVALQVMFRLFNIIYKQCYFSLLGSLPVIYLVMSILILTPFNFQLWSCALMYYINGEVYVHIFKLLIWKLFVNSATDVMSLNESIATIPSLILSNSQYSHMECRTVKGTKKEI